LVGKPKTAEMHPGAGFRVCIDTERPNVETIAALREFETPAISDQMNRLYTMASEVRNLTDPALQLVGPAVTVKTYPGDNLMVHKALDVALPGDVICIDTSGSTTTAVLGDLVSTKASSSTGSSAICRGSARSATSPSSPGA
jgi:regulator of RNase E activity RraA